MPLVPALMSLYWGCTTPLADNTPYVTEPRVLAVRVDPPEAEAGEDIALTALYADSSGALDEAPVDWSFCVTPRPLAELGPVAESCLVAGSGDLEPIGAGLTVSGVLPADGCSLFGPNPPPSTDGTSAGRPTDPDFTGGFYQPIVGFEGDTPSTLVSARLRCGLANVTQETYTAWNSAYHDNENPQIATVTTTEDGGPSTPLGAGSDPPTVSAGAEMTLAVSWPTCPETGVCGDGVCSADEDLAVCPEDCTTPVGCGGAETYVVYDVGTKVLDTRREAISATWFATAGTFDEARNGRSGDDEGTGLTNGWAAPGTAGEVWLGVVLRDERGGVNFGSYRVNVVTP